MHVAKQSRLALSSFVLPGEDDLLWETHDLDLDLE